jgi:hypothetical protein
MCAKNDNYKPGVLRSVLGNKCARCRRGNLFQYRNPYDLKHMLTMPERCPVCGQLTEIEVGFYFGTGYVSYALAIMVSVASFIAWKLLVGMSLNDYSLFVWMGCNALLLILLQPVLMRLSRTIWLYFFVPYDVNWMSGRSLIS